MSSQIFNIAKAKIMSADLDLDGATIKIALVMTNTTIDTENDAKSFVGDFTTLDECNATGYSRKTLGSKTVSVDDSNDRGVFDAADAAFTGLSGDASRDIQGALIYKHVTNDADSIPLAYIEFSSLIPKTATEIDVPFNASGIILLT